MFKEKHNLEKDEKILEINSMKNQQHLSKKMLNKFSYSAKQLIRMSVLTLSVLAFLLPFTASAQFSGGNGTEGNPYIITTSAQLGQLRVYVNSNNTTYNDKHYKLGNDISLSAYSSGAGWEPIGINVSTTDMRPFLGVFDGDNKVITNLYINNTTQERVGLFGTIMGGTVKNLGVENVNITSTTIVNAPSGVTRVGGVVGNNNTGVVSNCYSTGSVYVTTTSDPTSDTYAGGVVGFNSGTVSNCYSTSSVFADANNESTAGGVVGGNNVDCSVSNCYSTGSVTSYSSAGGVVGNNNGPVSNCYSTGSITSSSYVGGVVGRNNSTVSSCYSTGTVRSSSLNYGTAGGVVGDNNGTVSNCYSTSSVTANYLSGGVSSLNSGTVSNCAALNSSISSTGTNFGRVVGYSHEHAVLTDNIAFDIMLNPAGGTTWNNIGALNKDGADITALSINADGTLGGRFTAVNGWTTQNGKLPGLFGNVVDMPEHLILQPPVITTTSLPDGETGIAYNQTLTAAISSTPITWSLESGNLPSGLNLTSGGIILGIPTNKGVFNFTVKATNESGFDTKGLSIFVNIPGYPYITTENLPNGKIGEVYNQTLAAISDTPVTWSLESGSLPDGLGISANGVILGMPTANGMFNFTVKVINSVGFDTKDLSIIIGEVGNPPVITTTTLPNGTTGTAYNQTLTTTGDTPITWTLESGNLPNNLSLSTDGIISGTPTTVGTSNFKVRATNSAGFDTKELSINVIDDVGISDNSGTNSITVYPNPTSGELTIDNGQLINGNVEIFDVLGRCVHSFTCPPVHLFTIDISHLQAGVYFLHVNGKVLMVIRN